MLGSARGAVRGSSRVAVRPIRRQDAPALPDQRAAPLAARGCASPRAADRASLRARMRRGTRSYPSRWHLPRRPSRRPASASARGRRGRSLAEEPAVRRARAEHPDLEANASIPTFGGDPSTFEVLFYTPGEESQYGSDIRVEVVVSGLTGEVLEVWTGPQAATPLARGEEPAVGKSLNAPYVWLPLAAIFLAAFFDPRRPRRLLHLDLAGAARLRPQPALLQPGPHRRVDAARVPAAGLSPGPDAARRLPAARALRAARAEAPGALDGDRARAAGRVPRRPEPGRLERDRRGLCERRGCRPDRAR